MITVSPKTAKLNICSLTQSTTIWAILAMCLLLPPKHVSASTQPATTEVIIAVAANFKHTLSQLITLFSTQSSAKFKVVSGSSGQLYHQIINGAPYHIFLSADTHYVHNLQKHNMELTSLPSFIYAEGRLALWQPKPATTSLNNISLQEVFDPALLKETLIKHSIHSNIRLALANPNTAPYGSAAAKLIQQAFQNKLPAHLTMVTGSNISQVFAWTQTGHAQFGMVAYSHLLQAGIPAHQYRLLQMPTKADLQQALIVIPLSTISPSQLQVITQFHNFLTSPEAKALIQKAGYHVNT